VQLFESRSNNLAGFGPPFLLPLTCVAQPSSAVQS
jgi:hypothetical protein